MTRFYKGKKSQQRSVDENPDWRFFIAQDFTYGEKSSKQYSGFKSIEDFFEFEKGLHEKCCYETLKDGNQLIEIYDIDGDFSQDAFQDKDGNPISDEELISTFIDARIDFQTDTYPDIPLCYNNFLIKKTDDPTGKKLSLHVLIRNGYKFNDIIHLKNHVNAFQKYYKGVYKVQIDSSIYSRNRLIRILGHHKIGQNKRFSYRYKYHSIRNQNCSRKLFFASYLEGNEKCYPTCTDKSKETEEDKQNREIMQQIQLECTKLGDEDVKRLVELILETVDDENSQLCDPQIKNKMNYGQWWRFIVTVFNCCEEENTAKYLYKILFYYYRHCDTIDYNDYYNTLFSKKGEYNQLTINSLHYYARENLKYKEIFQNQIAEFKEKILKVTSEDYEKIKKTRKDRRTKDQQKFLDNVNNKILDRQIENLFTYRNNEIIKKEIVPDSVRYVKDIIFPEGYRCVGIHAGLGCGKTSSLIRKVKEMPENAKVLILSPRITFSKNICAEYNSQLDDKRQFTCYLDYRKNGKNQKEMNFLNKIVMSMEGMHYLESFTPDLLIIDEVNANLISHVSVETNGKNIDNNIYQFKRLLEFSKNVVVADAFLGSKVCNFFTDLKIPLHVYKYERKLDRKDAVILKSVDKDVKKAIKEKITNIQKQKEQIYNISQSQKLISKLLKQGKKLHAFFSTRSKLELQQKLSSNYNCLFYSGVSQNEIPDNLNETWSEKDLIANTCTITVGINHDRQNVFYTKLINFQSSSKNNVSDAIQSHYRVRNIIDDKIYVEVDEDSVFNNTPINIDELNERLEHKVEWYSKLNKNFSAVPEYLNNLIKHNYIENQLSQKASLKMMIRYLKDCNYNIVYDVEIQDSDDESDESDEKVDEDEDCEEVNLLKEFAKNCPNFIRFKELEDQKLKRKLTEKELEEMNKYWFINLYTGGTIKGIQETKLPTIALAYRLWKAKFSGNKTIRAMRLEKMVLNGIITIEELVEKRFDKTQFAELQSGDIMRVKRILEVCNKLGLKHSNDTETIITQESIDDFYEQAHEEYDEIRRDMNLQDKRKTKEDINSKQFTGLIKGCFTNCESSLCTMKLHKSERKKVKGKVVRTNTYKLYPNDKIQAEMIINNRIVREQNEMKGDYEEIQYQNVSQMIYDNLEIRDSEELPRRLMRKNPDEEKKEK
jgi:hypothetical protein